MAPPRLTFFCELEAGELPVLLHDRLIRDLSDLRASVSLGILDRSPERAEAARRLNQAGIPVVAWLLLPREEGYWFNLENVSQAQECYQAFRVWTAEQGLHWGGVGVDIEPDIRDMQALHDPSYGKSRLLAKGLRRSLDRSRLRLGRHAYQQLIRQIRADGYRVDSYQHPFIVDERLAGSSLLQRITGWVDIKVDREVLMLYSSIYRPHGAGLLASYAPQAQSIGLGTTGGGVEPMVGSPQPLSWEELARDLRLAYYYCDDLHIFSLEGCVQQGFLGRLKHFTWDQPILLPDDVTRRVDGWRGALRSSLWFAAHLPALLAGSAFGMALVLGLRRSKRVVSGE